MLFKKLFLAPGSIFNRNAFRLLWGHLVCTTLNVGLFVALVSMLPNSLWRPLEQSLFRLLKKCLIRKWYPKGSVGFMAKSYPKEPKSGANCLLYTSDAADDSLRVDLGGRRIIKKIVILHLSIVFF